jgi:membrane-bound lytic murein transglycosylase B|tara:strand:- start:1615 stop:2091 length:477 start_codon:yes stop_codon:yes gene_type:complete
MLQMDAATTVLAAEGGVAVLAFMIAVVRDMSTRKTMSHLSTVVDRLETKMDTVWSSIVEPLISDGLRDARRSNLVATNSPEQPTQIFFEMLPPDMELYLKEDAYTHINSDSMDGALDIFSRYRTMFEKVTEKYEVPRVVIISVLRTLCQSVKETKSAV